MFKCGFGRFKKDDWIFIIVILDCEVFFVGRVLKVKCVEFDMVVFVLEGEVVKLRWKLMIVKEYYKDK